MSSKVKWHQRNADKKLLKNANIANEARGETLCGIIESQRALDIADCRAVSTDPNVWEETRIRSNRWLDWLLEHSGKTLGQGDRARLDSVLSALNIIRQKILRGETILPRTRTKRAWTRAWNMVEQGKTPRPDWMSNPALLPKRPPGQ